MADAAASPAGSSVMDTASSPPSSSTADLATTLPRLDLYFRAFPVQSNYAPSTGRYVTAKKFIAKDEVLFQSRAYVKGVNESYRRRVCDQCWKFRHGKGFELHCNKCFQVYWCSRECMLASLGNDADADTNTDSNGDTGSGSDPLTYTSVDDHCIPMDRGYHRYECAAFKRMNSVKLDKDSAGLIKAIIRIYYKQKHCGDSDKSLAATDAELGPLSESSQHILTPRACDFAMLVGHEAVPVSQLLSGSATRQQFQHSSHLLFWFELKKDFVRLMKDEPLVDLFTILSKLESNAFGLYAPPREDAPEDELGLKVIGRSLYPTASYFNHNCSPNCHVFQTGSVLSVHAMRDIAEGEECCITYIDTHQAYANRQRDLNSTYHFDCRCQRCLRDVASGTTNSHAGTADDNNEANGDGTASEDKPVFTKKKYVKRGKPKKKKIEVKSTTASGSASTDPALAQQMSNIKIYQ